MTRGDLREASGSGRRHPLLLASLDVLAFLVMLYGLAIQSGGVHALVERGPDAALLLLPIIGVIGALHVAVQSLLTAGVAADAGAYASAWRFRANAIFLFLFAVLLVLVTVALSRILL